MRGPARAALAGLAYAAAVFLIGAVLGAVRVLALEPRLGAVAATGLELPVILCMAWLLCASLVISCSVPARKRDRLLMGGLAFLLLIGAELGLAALFGTMPDYRRPALILGLAGQFAFASFPLLQARFLARRARALP
jgi:hypothetical protein